MGINGLLPLIVPTAKVVSLKEFRKKRVAIDASGWIHRGCYSCAWELGMGIQTTKYVSFIERMIRLLLEYDIEPILVFDGEKFMAKRNVDMERSAHRKAKLEQGKELVAQGRKQEAVQMFAQAVSITKEMVQETIKLCIRLHIPYIVSPYECDAELAYLSRSGIVDAVISEDSDTLCFRCPCVLFKMTDCGVCKKVEFEDLFSTSQFDKSIWTADLFELLCVLSGCDYLHHLPYVGLKTAKKYIEKHPSKSSVVEFLLSQKCHQCTPQYVKSLDDAIVSFRHQVVFDPILNDQVYLTPFDSDCSLSEAEKDSLCGIRESTFAKEYARGYGSGSARKAVLDQLLNTEYVDEYFRSIQCSGVPSICRLEHKEVLQGSEVSCPVVETPRKHSCADLTGWGSKRTHVSSPTNHCDYFDNMVIDEDLIHEIETLEKEM